ncbi:helix-turn-helix domain-containing protein [Providencia sp. PROV247]|uniref:helix-turn-helix domain-containing protein n=1 Tax=Providencia sp. PROV247 TaxID=2949938 RepID=UPI00234A222C|nr:helix-turn-helix domain-containing protein [Providencia sp. PROV247]
MTSTKKKISETQDKKLTQKWGKETMQQGFAAIPNILIEKQRELQITPIEMNILLILLKYWWEKDKYPYPSKSVISDYIDKEESTVRRTIKSLEGKGLLNREKRFQKQGGQTSNQYDLEPLVTKLKELSKEENRKNKLKQEIAGKERRGK